MVKMPFSGKDVKTEGFFFLPVVTTSVGTKNIKFPFIYQHERQKPSAKVGILNSLILTNTKRCIKIMKTVILLDFSDFVVFLGILDSTEMHQTYFGASTFAKHVFNVHNKFVEKLIFHPRLAHCA